VLPSTRSNRAADAATRTVAASLTDDRIDALARTFGEALAIIQAQYVDAGTSSTLQVAQAQPLVVLALRGLDRRFASRGISVAVVGESVAIAYSASGGRPERLTLRLTDPISTEDGVQLVARAVTFLKDRPALRLDEVRDALLHGLMDADPGGAYLDPPTYRESQARDPAIIGLEIAVRDGALVVVAVLEGTAAFRAGLHAGDRIAAIDGRATKDMSLSEVAQRMQGRAGSKVTLGVVPARRSERKNVELIRERIPEQPPQSHYLGNGLATSSFANCKNTRRATSIMRWPGSQRTA
jgi:membrane-associated protease RseP (regulator of RpoE activity)